MTGLGNKWQEYIFYRIYKCSLKSSGCISIFFFHNRMQNGTRVNGYFCCNFIIINIINIYTHSLAFVTQNITSLAQYFTYC